MATKPKSYFLRELLKKDINFTHSQLQIVFTKLNTKSLKNYLFDQLKAKSKFLQVAVDELGFNKVDMFVYFGHFYPNFEEFEKTMRCHWCGKRVHFSVKTGIIPTACSHGCVLRMTREQREATILEKYGGFGNASKYIKDKATKTCLEKYGTTNPFGNREIIEKCNKTFNEKYGGRTLKNKDIAAKFQNTMLKRYGARFSLCSPELSAKIKAFYMKKYGTKSCKQRISYDGKISQSYIKLCESSLSRKYKEILKFELVEPMFPREKWYGYGKNYYPLLYKWRCKECGRVFYSYVESEKNPPICLDCHPNANAQAAFESFLKDTGHEILVDDVTALRGTKISLYLPKLHLGFEYLNDFNKKGDVETEFKNKQLLASKCGIYLIKVSESEWLKKIEATKKSVLTLIEKMSSIYGVKNS